MEADAAAVEAAVPDDLLHRMTGIWLGCWLAAGIFGDLPHVSLNDPNFWGVSLCVVAFLDLVGAASRG